MAAAAAAAAYAAEEEDETPPSATFKVKNLEEKIKIPVLITSLRELFSEYGTIIDVVAKKNLKGRGQAFVVFDSIDGAQNAIDELQGFELSGKQMNLDFAKTRSDATVEKEEGAEGIEAHKRHRLADKERKKAAEQAAAQKKRPAIEVPEPLAERPAKAAKPTPATGAIVPDEYLPPNKILFLRELPESYGKEGLAVIFGRFAGFREVRTVPGRKNIAFVEYESEEGAISAKEATSGMELDGKAIRVTFQRQ